MLSPGLAPFDAQPEMSLACFQRGLAAHAAQDVAQTRQALRAWMQTHPSDTEVLLGHEHYFTAPP